MSEFANNFKALRVQAGLSQAELARRLSVSKSTIGMYERGERRPDFELLERIADFFGVDVTYLISTADRVNRLSGSVADDTAAAGGIYVRLDALEREMVKAYRLASEDTRAAVRAVLGLSGGGSRG